MSLRFDTSDPVSRAHGLEAAASAVRRGDLVVLPTDTVYGLCADPENRAAAREVYRLKGREARQPTALQGVGSCKHEDRRGKTRRRRY